MQGEGGATKRYLLFKLHHNGHLEVAFIGDMETSKAVEAVQRKAASMGWATGITWKLHEGDIVSALIELAHL